jgi:hypothetical protein
MSKVLSIYKQVFSMVLVVTLGLVAAACNAAPASVIHPIIVINTPLNNTQIHEGDQVSVQSTSSDQSGVIRVELLVDSTTVRSDQLSKSQTTAVMFQTWIATPGTHTITVRAVNMSNVSSAPASIAISVVPASPAAIIVAPTALPVVQVIAVTATPVPSPCVNNAAFISDITVPDKTVFAAGQTFTKIWRVKNTGTCTWGNGEELVFVHGEAMTPAKSVAIPATVPGGTSDLSVAMTSPTAPGNYISNWRMRNRGGTIFGSTLNVTLNIPGPTPINTPISCPSAPVIESFNASSTTITAGQSVILSWGSVTGAQTAEIDNEIGGVATPGNIIVNPTTTTTYTLTGLCGDKSKSLSVTINVNPVAIMVATPTATEVPGHTPTVKPIP